METLKTATGKEFPCNYVTLIESPPRLTIRLENVPLPTVAAVFSDPKETAQIFHGKNYIAQHTKLEAIIPEGNVIRVVLTKE